MKKTILIISSLILITLLRTGNAYSDNNSMFTICAGTQLGVSHFKDFKKSSQSMFVGELNFRTKFLYFLGMDFSYNLNDTNIKNENLVFLSNYRLSALLYPVPTNYFSIYLSAGIGAKDFSDIVSVKGDTNSYHAGAGLEIYLGDHFTFTGEFLWLVPGANSIEKTATVRAALEVERYTQDPEHYIVSSDLLDVSASDFLSPKNFQITFGIKYFL